VGNAIPMGQIGEYHPLHSNALAFSFLEMGIYDDDRQNGISYAWMGVLDELGMDHSSCLTRLERLCPQTQMGPHREVPGPWEWYRFMQ